MNEFDLVSHLPRKERVAVYARAGVRIFDKSIDPVMTWTLCWIAASFAIGIMAPALGWGMAEALPFGRWLLFIPGLMLMYFLKIGVGLTDLKLRRGIVALGCVATFAGMAWVMASIPPQLPSGAPNPAFAGGHLIDARDPVDPKALRYDVAVKGARGVEPREISPAIVRGPFMAMQMFAQLSSALMILLLSILARASRDLARVFGRLGEDLSWTRLARRAKEMFAEGVVRAKGSPGWAVEGAWACARGAMRAPAHVAAAGKRAWKTMARAIVVRVGKEMIPDDRERSRLERLAIEPAARQADQRVDVAVKARRNRMRP